MAERPAGDELGHGMVPVPRAAAATRALLTRFAADAAEVPSLWHLELANALALAERRRRITPARAAEFVGLIARLPIIVDEETPRRVLDAVLDLARSARLTACDAAYLDLAMRRGLPLATKDRELAKAARRVSVTVLQMGWE